MEDVLKLSRPFPHVLWVQLNQPPHNLLNDKFFQQLSLAFSSSSNLEDVRVVVISAVGKRFTAGLDFGELTKTFGSVIQSDEMDTARKALVLQQIIKKWQDSVSSLEKCHVPVLVAVHGDCIGGGVDLITAADVRIATKDATFSVKEVDVGLAADLGTLQRLPRVVNNDSWTREVCFTGRTFTAMEAKQVGLLGGVFENQDEMMKEIWKLAKSIASKSPVAVMGTKKLLNYSREHGITNGLEYTFAWNAAMLQTKDIETAVQAAMMRKAALFSKL